MLVIFSVGDLVVVRPLVAVGDCYACSSGNDHICYNLKFLGLDCDGAFQEKWNVPASTLHKLPADIKLDHAALIEPLAVACHDVSRSFNRRRRCFGDRGRADWFVDCNGS